MDDDFRIKISSTIINNSILKCEATISYDGEDSEFIEYMETLRKDELAKVTITFDSRTTNVYKSSYSDENGNVIKRMKYEGYNGFLNSYYNYLTQYKLDKVKFPFLNKLKGISYGLLLCCICQALNLDFITPSSKIILEASGGIKGMDPEISMRNLVKNYEKIGFKQMYPELYELSIKNMFVPMVGSVKDIIGLCTFKYVSKELLNILPIKMCKDMCK